MLVQSAPQILFIKVEYKFRFSIFFIIGVCNSLANYLFLETTPELITVPLFILEVFLSKNHKPLKQLRVYIHHIAIFLQ